MNSMKSKLLSLQIVLMVSLFSVMACSSSDSSEMSEMITLENDLSDKVSHSSVSEFGDKEFTKGSCKRDENRHPISCQISRY